MKVRETPLIPAALLAALEKARLQYTSAICVYHYVWLWGENYCGVFGDGENVAYEWFVWRDGVLKTSDVGYGDCDVALRDVLNKEVVA